MSKKLKQIYSGMIYRCHSESKKNRVAKYYRDAGITVCYDWRNSYQKFESWAMENGYREGLCIDRIDPYGNYEPNNCRWLTRSDHAKYGKRRKFIPDVRKKRRSTVKKKRTVTKEQVITLLSNMFDSLSERDCEVLCKWLNGYIYHATHLQNKESEVKT